MFLPSRCLAMNVYSDLAIQAYYASIVKVPVISRGIINTGTEKRRTEHNTAGKEFPQEISPPCN
jgi:hypothetical protein